MTEPKKKSPVASLFATDPKLERDGVWHDYGEFKLLIARAGGHNRAYMQTAEAVMRPYRRQIQLDMLAPEKSEELMMTIFARSVMRGWEGITDDEGEPLPFTVENCVDLFTKFPDLFADVREVANRIALYRVAETEVDAGN